MTLKLKPDFSNLKGDFFGGVTAGIVALPLALAFGDQTELGAMAGLYGAAALALLAAVFGGTPTQISGPTAPMTVVSAAVIASAITESGANTVEEAFLLIVAVFFLSGFIEMLFGIIRLGRYIRYIPYPVVSGFMSGIGVIIIITQVFPLLGYNPTADGEFVAQRLPHAEEVILEEILREEEAEGILSGVMSTEDLEETTRRAQLVTQDEIQEEAEQQASRLASGTVGTIKFINRPFSIPGGINWINLLLGVLTIVLIYGLKRITTAVPSTLVALILISLVAYFFFPGQVPVIGNVKEGIPPIHLGFFSYFLDFGLLPMMLKFAFTLAALGAIDSLLTSVVADNLTKTKHDSNREPIGQGVGNMGSALIGGLPGAGATMRTVININSGGRTRISGVVAGILLFAMLIGLGPVVAYIPKGVLAGILFTVGVGIIDYKAFRHFRTVPMTDIAIMLVVLFLTVFVDLLVAVAVGMILAALLFMRSFAKVVEHKTETASSNLREFVREKPWADEGDIVDRLGHLIYIKHLDGPLFFGFSNRFQEMIQALPDISVVVIRMDKVPYIDQSGLYALEETVMDLQQQGIQAVFTGLHGQPETLVRQLNMVPGLVEEAYNFDTFRNCRVWLSEYLIEVQAGQDTQVT